MKTFFLSFSAVMAVASVSAQLTLGSEVFPEPGDQGGYYALDQQIEPGNGGSNQYWDFSDILIQTDMQMSNYVSPESTGVDDLFGAATVAGDNDGSYSFMTVATQSFEDLGSASDDGTVLHYVNPIKRAQFPMQLGTSYTDEFSGTYFMEGVQYGSSYGTVTSEVDGEGTLEINDRIYHNCLRVHNVDTMYMQYDMYESTWVLNWYTWFAEGIKFPVMEYVVYEVTSMLGTTIDYALSVTAAEPVTVGVSDQSNAPVVAIYPNPCNDQLNLKNISGAIEIRDLAGRVVMRENVLGTAALNVEMLSEGAYILRYFDENGGEKCERFVKSK
jgi:hypothetical protein